MMRRMLFAAVLAATSLPAAAAFSQGNTPQPGAETKGAALAKEDREFINKAGLDGLSQVRAGQVAAQRAQSSDVKQLGQKMVDDHTAVNGRLQKLAQQKGLSLPAQLDKKHQDKIDSLSKKTGVDFDKAFVDEMIDDHKSKIDEFEKAAKDAKDPGVKDFAATTLPALREHLQAMQTLKDKLK